MGTLGKDKANVTSCTTKQKRAYVKARAGRLSWSISQFMGKILDNWFDSGCPAVDSIETKLPRMPFNPDKKEDPKP